MISQSAELFAVVIPECLLHFSEDIVHIIRYLFLDLVAVLILIGYLGGAVARPFKAGKAHLEDRVLIKALTVGLKLKPQAYIDIGLTRELHLIAVGIEILTVSVCYLACLYTVIEQCAVI